MPLVSTISVALAATDDIAKFNLASSNTGHLDGFNTGNDSEQSCEVRTVRLASIIPPEWDQSCLWLKLDIEGAEYEVLRDALRAGIRPGVISGEIHDYFGANGAGLVAELESLNYSVIVEGSG
jgi:FkbM family methyltransferase